MLIGPTVASPRPVWKRPGQTRLASQRGSEAHAAGEWTKGANLDEELVGTRFFTGSDSGTRAGDSVSRWLGILLHPAILRKWNFAEFLVRLS